MSNHPCAVYYRIQPVRPEAHVFEVECRIPEPDLLGQRLSLPAWIPGSYMIRDFARNIITLEARSADGPLPVEKLDKQTWQCAPADGEIVVRYEVYAWDLSVRTAHLDTRHAFFNGTSVFLQVHGKENKACQVEIQRPAGEAYTDWEVATSLEPVASTAPWQAGCYIAADYDELIDHPVEMGTFTRASFEVAGVPHHVVITGQHRADTNRLCRDLQAICSRHVALFGGLPPIRQYLFLVMVVGDGYGGLEHRASTALLCSRDSLPLATRPEMNDKYREFLGLCSHEYFHTWNIKRIKPAAFSPYDLSHENYTRQLWAFEGITSYYDDLALRRSGRIDTDSYLELLGQVITRVWRGQGRFRQSVAESSFDAWTKFYKQDESAPDYIVSYYTKGSLIALALDLLIRKHSADVQSLDDLMRRLWQDYGKIGTGVREGEIETLASELAGQDLGDFFARCLYGTEDPPLAELLAEVGVAFRLRAATSLEDRGGKPLPADTPQPLITLGARTESNPLGVRLCQVFAYGPACRAGLAAGDVIIALDELKVDKATLESRLQTCRPGDTVTVHAFRRDELFVCQLPISEAAHDTCYLEVVAEVAAEVQQRRARWLGDDPAQE